MFEVTHSPKREDDITLNEALADELVLASRRLADLAFELASDEDTLRRHMTSMQDIDHVTQIQLSIADLLRNGVAGLGDITLGDMASRIRCKIG